jgi:dihydrofolate reductase
MGKPVIMGRKTYDSIGRPLPGRTIIVVTRDEGFAVEGVLRAPSIEAAINMGQDVARNSGANEIMVAGGGEIYAQTLPRADRLYLTLVLASPEGDTRFVWDKAAWTLIESTSLPMGEKDSAATSFQVFERHPPL